MILLYCTGRGTHNRVDLYRVAPDNGAEVTATPVPGWNGRRAGTPLPDSATEPGPDTLGVRTAAAGGGMYLRLTLPCRKCPRRPVLTGARLRAIITAAAAAGHAELDLSRLD